MRKNIIYQNLGRRDFIKKAGIGVGAGVLSLQQAHSSLSSFDNPPPIEGFDDHGTDSIVNKKWIPVSNRKIRVGLVGYGVCQFAASFGFQDHPNVEVAAVSKE